MSDSKNEPVAETIMTELKEIEKTLRQELKDGLNKINKDLLLVQNRLYIQLESLSWLQKRLKIQGQLPPLRGWAASPDVLLCLHEHIMLTRPQVVVEFGSGASTLVIADALHQNGIGKLFSIEHSDYYGAQTLANLQVESLDSWVDLRVGNLELWKGRHLNPTDAEKPSYWYPSTLLQDIEYVDLLWVDGPPGSTCLFSRYPAVPALADKFSDEIEVWLDDTARKEEKDICSSWANDYGFDLTYLPLEKGLGRLTRPRSQQVSLCQFDVVGSNAESSQTPEQALGFDFSLPERGFKG